MFLPHKNTFFSSKRYLNIKGNLLTYDNPLIMGILNITNDSFYDGGRYSTYDAITKRVNAMINEGADIIDIGAVSTRPGAQEICKREEQKILLPVVELIRKSFPEIIISVDTSNAETAEKSIIAGADIINDISGGTWDEAMYHTVAALKAPYILMHIKGKPENMQKNPEYINVLSEVMHFFSTRLSKLRDAGVADIIIDPGFGFGKTVAHNYNLLNNLDAFSFFGLPLLVGLSRKSMITKVLNTIAENALNGTTALNTIALMKGAKILRVHDVKEASETIKIFKSLNNIT